MPRLRHFADDEAPVFCVRVLPINDYEWLSECTFECRRNSMLRIDKDSDGYVTRLRLRGRIQSDCVASIRSAMDDGCTHKVLDLNDVTLVDVAVVRFLISCENEGIEVVQCSPYIREWMVRERAEGAQLEPSHDN